MNVDSQLALNVRKNNCEDSLKKLIEKHSRLCFDICKKYRSALKASGIPPEDVTDEKDYIIYKSAVSYNPSKKAKFSTWLGNQVRYACLNKMNKSKRLILMDDFELDFLSEKVSEKSLEEDFCETKDYINCILSQMKDPRIKRVFTLRYFNGSKKCMPWVKIGLRMSVSSQTAINLHEKGRKTLITKINQDYRSDFV